LRLAGQLSGCGAAIARLALILVQLEPQAVVGFGGYPSVPPLLAAARLGFPWAA
jgi:UDP-N-acetylglucosamine--N-acetylmuramyl-(pentapeptide) pyrophosphoryl-undecaprenol N-acetylglucosamine transferase